MTEKVVLQRLGAKIKKLRKEKKIAQLDLAFLCDFEKASMSRIEAGKTNPTILTLHKICKHLDVEMSDLFKD